MICAETGGVEPVTERYLSDSAARKSSQGQILARTGDDLQLRKFEVEDPIIESGGRLRFQLEFQALHPGGAGIAAKMRFT